LGRSVSQVAPSAPVDLTAHSAVPTTYLIKVITPLFGGGTTPGKVDTIVPETLIRVPSIRGHLRWWFRATSRSIDVDDLRKAEASIFGSTNKASPVRITAKITRGGRPVKADELAFRDGDRLFPVFPGHVKEADCLRLDVEFELTVSGPPEALRQLETAVWAWTNFGGIGAKTRRGCGALYCAAFAPRVDAVSGKIQLQGWSNRVSQAPSQSNQIWPRLVWKPLVRRAEAQMTPLSAWRAGIEAYRDFRQKGPEAHRLASYDPLGYAGNGGRMASPILIRPMALDGGMKAVPMVVPLSTGAPATQAAVKAVVLHLFKNQEKNQKFEPVGEY
jgi:CRISPR type III-B/RAMP module RAMP protein Cmr1